MSEIINIENRIFTFRNQQVMVDKDLAEMYQVETKVLNQAVKRNIERFPDKFRFQLNSTEKTELVTNCDRFISLKHSSSFPYVFTEQGVAMLSAVLRSETAIAISISIMDAFVKMRKSIAIHSGLLQRMNQFEIKQVQNDQNFERIFKALEHTNLPVQQGIFFDGQIFDAYVFMSDLIKSAKKDIVLIDNYIDETVLLQLQKRNPNCTCTIYTQNPSKTLQLDLTKHNAQYPKIEIKHFNKAHDRFLIIDHNTVYHIGASLKDLGKKWFAFSKLQINPNQILNLL